MSPSNPITKGLYKLAIVKIPPLVFASFGITLLAKAAAKSMQLIVKHETAFDAAVELLLHYPKSFRSIAAFFVATLCLLCFTLIIEPSYLGKKIRNGIINPSLSIAEHMISLALGVICAWLLLEFLATGNPFPSIYAAVVQIGLAIFGISLLAILCAALRVFLIHDYESFFEEFGAWRYPLVAILALFIIAIFFSEYIWNYSAAALAH